MCCSQPSHHEILLKSATMTGDLLKRLANSNPLIIILMNSKHIEAFQGRGSCTICFT